VPSSRECTRSTEAQPSIRWHSRNKAEALNQVTPATDSISLSNKRERVRCPRHGRSSPACSLVHIPLMSRQSGGEDARAQTMVKTSRRRGRRISSACQLPSCSLLCELDEEPDNHSSNDEEHRVAHSRGRSAITLGTSRLPIPLADVGFGLRDGRDKIRHRSASWMLWDMLWRRSLHHRIITNGGRERRPRERSNRRVSSRPLRSPQSLQSTPTSRQ